jgi:hypothetical protein
MQSQSACNSFPISAPTPASDSIGRQDKRGAARNVAALRLIVKLFRRIFSPSYIMVRESVTSVKVLSRYDADVYGQPRVLSRLEVVLHAVAWPIIIGVLIGFGLAISALSFHHALSALPGKVTPTQALIQEANL